LPVLFTSEKSPEVSAKRIERVKALGTDGVLRWSRDLAQGVYFRGVLFFALQVAAYLIGRGTIYIFGLDWKGSHHHSDRKMQQNMKRWQGEALTIAKSALERQNINVFNCNPDSRCGIFERIDLGSQVSFPSRERKTRAGSGTKVPLIPDSVSRDLLSARFSSPPGG
jgi:hypothetical protein